MQIFPLASQTSPHSCSDHPGGAENNRRGEVKRQLLQSGETAGPCGLQLLCEWAHRYQYGWRIKVWFARQQTYFAALDVNEKAPVCQQGPTGIAAQGKQTRRSGSQCSDADAHHLHQMSHHQERQRVPRGKAWRIAIQPSEGRQHLAPVTQRLVRQMRHLSDLLWGELQHGLIVCRNHHVVNSRIDGCRGPVHSESSPGTFAAAFVFQYALR